MKMKNFTDFLILAGSITLLYFVITKSDELDKTTVFTYKMINNVDFCTPYSEERVAHVKYSENKYIKQKISINVSGFIEPAHECMVTIQRQAIGKRIPKDIPYENMSMKCTLDDYARRDLAKNMTAIQYAPIQESMTILNNLLPYSNCKIFYGSNGKMIEYDRKKQNK